MGFNPKYAHPAWMVLTVLPVPPPAVRPSVQMDSSSRCVSLPSYCCPGRNAPCVSVIDWVGPTHVLPPSATHDFTAQTPACTVPVLCSCSSQHRVERQSCGRSEDDLTHKLAEIIKANNKLKRQDQNGAPQHIIREFSQLLQFHITTYFDNTKPGQPVAAQVQMPTACSVHAWHKVSHATELTQDFTCCLIAMTACLPSDLPIGSAFYVSSMTWLSCK